MVDDVVLKVLNEHLFPSSPVRSEEMLQGRGPQLDEIDEALSSPGRSIFIYGDRGVGKTSLAQTAAFRHCPSSTTPVVLSCDKRTKFGGFMRDVCASLLGADPLVTRTMKGSKLSAKLSILGADKAREVEQGRVPIPETVNEAVALLSYSLAMSPDGIVIVVDEFDRLSAKGDRSMFGDLIKQIGDQGLPAKFVFCGVGRSLDDLLAGHESCYRYLAGIELDRLGISPSVAIIRAAAKALNLSVDDGYCYRIAQISDGFPHFVHLIGHKMFWEWAKNDASIDEITSALFEAAVDKAVASVEAHLKQAYTKATEKHGASEDYELVLWAAAAHPDLRRKAADIWESYCQLATELKKTPIDRATFNNRLNPLKQQSHGAALLGSRQGWYEFRLPMLRGLCRLRAQSQYSVSLGKEYYK